MTAQPTSPSDPAPPARPHTLILDGFLGRPWRWERLRRRIETDVGPATIFRYDSTGRTPLPALGRVLAAIARGYAGGVNLVGFSMGGMVIRAARAADPLLPVRRTVFMNSPHRGTWMAHLLSLPGVRQMRPGDPFVKALAATAWQGPTLTVWNGFDGIILPGRSTRLGTGEHVRCGVPIHIWPVWSRRIQRRVVTFLAG